MNILQRCFAYLRYREAVMMADKAYSELGRRFYVMPAFGGKCQLIVVDRKNFRLLKQKRYLSNKASVADMTRECFYHTPYSGGESPLSSDIKKIKYSQFLSWWAAERKSRKKIPIRVRIKSTFLKLIGR